MISETSPPSQQQTGCLGCRTEPTDSRLAERRNLASNRAAVLADAELSLNDASDKTTALILYVPDGGSCTFRDNVGADVTADINSSCSTYPSAEAPGNQSLDHDHHLPEERHMKSWSRLQRSWVRQEDLRPTSVWLDLLKNLLELIITLYLLR